MLTVSNLNKSFNGISALNNVSFELKEGTVLGIIGPNGAGKTTMMRILMGLIRADSGTAIYEYVDLLKDPRLTKQCVGFMPDFFGIYNNLKVKEYMEFYTGAYGMYGLKGRSRSAELLELTGLSEKKELFVSDLSKGMQQRLCLARVLIQQPAFLLLDEPFSGLDFENRARIQSLLLQLAEDGIGILISSHNLTELTYISTDIGMMESGRLLVQGSMNEVLKRINASNPLCLTIYDGKEKAIRILQQSPLVTSFSIDQNHIKIRFTGDERDEAALLKQMVQEGIMIQEFYKEQGNLEALFLKLTNTKKAGD